MDPIQTLMNEHRVIERVLTAMERRLAGLKRESFPIEFFEQALDFFRTYADACHHFKEEDTLFPAMNAKGFPMEAGPIGMMRYEHQVGRSHLAGIRANLKGAANGDTEALTAVRDHAFAYIQLLREHIQKEDNVLFQMALNALDAADFERLDRIFSDESNEKINRSLHERYEAIAADLERASLPEPVNH